MEYSIKIALKACNRIDWCETYPTFLSSVRSAVRSDTFYVKTEIVYVEKFHLPGKFLQASTLQISPGSFIQDQILLIGQRKTQQKFIPNILVDKDVESITHIFLRIDIIRKHLELSYESLYKVINHFSKYLTIKFKGNNMNVSINRLKQACILSDTLQ